MNISEILNNNQGVLTTVGIVFAIPFSIWAGRIIESSNNKSNKTEIERMLIHELWINLNNISQIERSYEKNLTDDKGIHVPHYPPRTIVIEKIVEFNLIKPLPYSNKLLEIYAQLSESKQEFIRWRNFTNSTNILLNKELYITQSSTLLSYIKPLMQNMLDLWLQLLSKQPDKILTSNFIFIKNTVNTEIRKSHHISSCYKSSELQTRDNKIKIDTIFCWINDSVKTKKGVIEVHDMAALFDTWAKEHPENIKES